MKKPFEIAHVFGKSCKICRKIFSFCSNCPICQGEVVWAMCSVQVPRGCLFVWDDGIVPGSDCWQELTEQEFDRWHENVGRTRPGQNN